MVISGERPELGRPGWAVLAGAPPSPLGTLDVLGLPSRRLSAACGLLLLLLLAASRFAAFPASIWDQDEAYLGLGVADFDPAANRPHPPWFPLWVAAGKLVEPWVSEPARGLQVLGAAAAVWTFYPLVALLAIWMRRELAAAAAVLYLFLPGPWFLSGRAFGDSTATFLLLLAAAWWLRPEPGRATLARGAIAAGLCLLVRPQLLPAVLGIGAFRWWGARGPGERTALLLPLLGVIAAGGVATVIAAGGVVPLWQPLAGHARFQLAGLAAADHGLAASGVARCLIRPELAVLWGLLAALGALSWIRSRQTAGGPWPLLAGGLAPLVVTVHWLSDPTRARYALPCLALSSGLVVAGLASCLGRRMTLLLTAAALTCSLAVGLPQAARYRKADSPAVAALRSAGRGATASGGIVVVERTLRSIADYLAAAGELRSPLVTDFSIEIGAAAPPPPEEAVAVAPEGRAGFIAASCWAETIRCDIPWVRRLESDRFLDVTVATGAQVVRSPTRW
ncbi:MAG TPA: hypothetical protein PLM61_11920 [Thermoanaerobaculales bacterium]|nr:hypothetical protein [Thermoanaerobaculales bacterium]